MDGVIMHMPLPVGSPQAVCVLFCYISQSNDTVLEKLLGILSNTFLIIVFITFTHAEWASAAVPRSINFYKCAFLQQTLPVRA